MLLLLLLLLSLYAINASAQGTLSTPVQTLSNFMGNTVLQSIPSGSTIVIAVTSTALSTVTGVNPVQDNGPVDDGFGIIIQGKYQARLVVGPIAYGGQQMHIFVSENVEERVERITVSNREVTGFVASYQGLALVDSFTSIAGQVGSLARVSTPSLVTSCPNTLLFLASFNSVIDAAVRNPPISLAFQPGSSAATRATDGLHRIADGSTATGTSVNALLTSIISSSSQYALGFISFKPSSCVTTSGCPMTTGGCLCGSLGCSLISDSTVETSLKVESNYTMRVTGSMTFRPEAVTSVKLHEGQDFSAPIISTSNFTLFDGILTISVGAARTIPNRFVLAQAASFSGSFRAINVTSSDPCILVQGIPEPSSSGSLSIALIVTPSGSADPSCTSSSSSTSIGLIIGVTIGAVAVAVAIVLLIVFLTKRARAKRTVEMQSDIQRKYVSDAARQ